MGGEVTLNTRMSSARVARALMFPHHEYNVPLFQLFGNETQEVIDEGLMIAAEWRQLDDMKELVKLGANVHYKNPEGFSILDSVLQGHDSYWLERWECTESAVRFLADHKVTAADIAHKWILDECCNTYIANSEYLRDFLKCN